MKDCIREYWGRHGVSAARACAVPSTAARGTYAAMHDIADIYLLRGCLQLTGARGQLALASFWQLLPAPDEILFKGTK